MSAPRGSTAPPAAPPAGARRSPVTEVITSETGAAVRRIRKLRVVIVDAPDPQETGRAFVFAQDEIRIGSSPDADVTINDPAISREHIAIRLGAHGWTVTDCGSTNGTFVGDLRVERASIVDDARIRLGKSAVRLESLAETVEQEISPRI